MSNFEHIFCVQQIIQQSYLWVKMEPNLVKSNWWCHQNYIIAYDVIKIMSLKYAAWHHYGDLIKITSTIYYITKLHQSDDVTSFFATMWHCYL